MDQQGFVDYQTDEQGVGTITFSHPAHNALPGYLLKALCDAIMHAGEDAAVRVILLQSAGNRTFCAGASFDELSAIQTKEDGLRFFSGFADVINACRTSPKLIVGRVQGKAVGGGVGLVAAVDYCVATRESAVRLSELSLGIGPFVIEPVLERKIGKAAVARLSIDAMQWMPAEWALSKGLYEAVYDSAADMDAAIARLLSQLCTYSSQAMQALKKILWEGTEHWDELLKQRAALSGELMLERNEDNEGMKE